MLEELFASGTLNLVYFGILLVSFFFVLLILVGSEIGDVFDFDLDADADTGLDFIDISPFALATFGAIFGMTGLITRVWLEMEPIPSILWSLGVGFVIGALAQIFFLRVVSPTDSSHYTLQNDAIGREAEVITTIPGKGLGEIAFNNVSGRVKLGARSATGEAIPYGSVVVIKRMIGRVAFVRPLE